MIKQYLQKLLGCGDYEELKQQYEKMHYLAHYDCLTGLCNRLMFIEESEKIFTKCVDQTEPLTIFIIDLDNFKIINDSHGHLAGNTVLQAIAKRIATVATYHEEDSVIAARLGGDEFVVLFEGMDKHAAEIAGEHLTTELRQPIPINGVDVSVSASVGGSIYPWHSDSITGLMRAADVAMYTAKETGKDKYAMFDSSMNTQIEKRAEAERMIREIIDTGKVNLYFQPITNLEHNKVIGMEALLRSSPGSHLFSPSELVEVAEETHLIIPLGTIILQQACMFARSCIDAGANLIMSVNVSAPQLVDANFNYIVTNALQAARLPAHNLSIEITETMLVSNFEKASIMLHQLRDLGVSISIDDFGKGYSLFNYLQQLPIQKLKIDMSFIESLGSDKKTNEIVRGIILMANALQLTTCAEGVETQNQADLLKEYGCTYAQGYYKYQALDTTQFLEMLKTEYVALA